jgi:hypothetical protein
MVMVELPVPGAGIGLGLKLTVVPVGVPEAESEIELLKPFTPVVVSVEVPACPWRMLNEAGEAEMVNVADAVTVSVTVVVCCTPPPLPATVIG